MKAKQIAAIVLLTFSIFAIIWSTLLQPKIPLIRVQHMYNKIGTKSFFYHTSDPGSVCWFGVFSGVLIVIYSSIQLWLVIDFLKSDDQTNIKRLLIASIVINLIIFFLMLLMNSYFVHSLRGIQRHGLFENSIPFFVTQFIAIGLLWPSDD